MHMMRYSNIEDWSLTIESTVFKDTHKNTRLVLSLVVYIGNKVE